MIGIFGSKKHEKDKNGGDNLAESALVLHTITDGILVIDASGNIKLANPASIQIVGWDDTDVVGLHWSSVLMLAGFNGQLLAEAENPIARMVANLANLQKSEITNTPGPELDAKDRFFQSKDYQIVTHFSSKQIPVSLTAIIADDGNDSVVVSFHDISAELKKNSEQSEFISTASHEMRTPVAAIEGFLGLALNPSTATIDDRARSYLEKAHDASEHLGRLFQDLLSTTALEDKRYNMRPEPVNVNELTQSIAGAMVQKAVEKGLSFSVMPSGSEHSGSKHIDPVFYANIDKDFYSEILQNFIENAIKYTHQGGITVDVGGDDNNVVLSVKDTGIGVAPEEVKHIFQKFYRVDNSDTREIGGTGLGLFITKKRAEAMGGRVWAESVLGSGSTFFASFPRISLDEYNQLMYNKNQGMLADDGRQ